MKISISPIKTYCSRHYLHYKVMMGGKRVGYFTVVKLYNEELTNDETQIKFFTDSPNMSTEMIIKTLSMQDVDKHLKYAIKLLKIYASKLIQDKKLEKEIATMNYRKQVKNIDNEINHLKNWSK